MYHITPLFAACRYPQLIRVLVYLGVCRRAAKCGVKQLPQSTRSFLAMVYDFLSRARLVQRLFDALPQQSCLSPASQKCYPTLPSFSAIMDYVHHVSIYRLVFSCTIITLIEAPLLPKHHLELQLFIRL